MKNKKNPFRFLVYFLIVLGFFGALFLVYLNSLKAPLDKNAAVKAFVVQKGETVSEIAERLEKEGYIESSLYFKYIYNQKYANTSIQAGDFKISAAMSVDEIIGNLSQGAVDRWVTFLEGWRSEQYAKELKDQVGIEEKDFMALSKEGYMFPDTYLFNKDATAETVVSTLENTFDKKYTPELQQKIKAKGLTPEQGVILASLVEREGRSDKVRTEVAGILLKRFKIGMKLDVDATVQYAKDTQSLKKGTLAKFWQPISRADYTGIVSPFNTYLNNGLPPAPICNPSLSSLNAVANANSNTPYLYYYHDTQGNSYYARTLEEHNENVANHR